MISPTRFAALVDLENVFIHHADHVPSFHSRQGLFVALDQSLASMPVRVACGGQVVKACSGELASRPWGLTLVPTEPNAADRALLEAGHEFAEAGVTDLVVVSGDHAFASLATVARVHVLARPHTLSAVLRMAATTVSYLPRPRHGASGRVAS